MLSQESAIHGSPTRILAIFGPSGSGKTDIAVHLAAKLNTVVVNVDPAQCYEGLPILSNAPEAHHDALAPHRMVAVWPLSFTSSVQHFSRQVHALIDELLEQYAQVVVCGGSGLYMRAALCNCSFGNEAEAGRVAPEPTATGDVVDGITNVASVEAPSRAAAISWFRSRTPEIAHRELSELDPAAASAIHPNDSKRIVRAYERATFGESVVAGNGSIWNTAYRHPTHITWLRTNRDDVRKRIGTRASTMFARGAMDEVATAVGDHHDPEQSGISLTARYIHGITEVCSVLRGEITQAEAEELLTIRSRKYVRRQDIWARRWREAVPLDVDITAADHPQTATTIMSMAQKPSALPNNQHRIATTTGNNI